jgi:hypothetical protein
MIKVLMSLLVGLLATNISPAFSSEKSGIAATQFFVALKTLCGRQFSGRIIADYPPPVANDPFTGKALKMHVRDCHDDEIRIPFSVGADQSRTWVISRSPSGLRLKHDHRHEDGTPDTITMYGGDTMSEGSKTRQSFPADAESIALFSSNNMPASLTNVWSLELVADQYFIYELARPGGRLFRVRFDITQ